MADEQQELLELRNKIKQLEMEKHISNCLFCLRHLSSDEVRIRNEEETLLLEDNYFDMNPGSKIIKVLKGELSGLNIRSVYDIR